MQTQLLCRSVVRNWFMTIHPAVSKRFCSGAGRVFPLWNQIHLGLQRTWVWRVYCQMVFVGTPESCRILHCSGVDYIITFTLGDVFFVNIAWPAVHFRCWCVQVKETSTASWLFLFVRFSGLLQSTTSSTKLSSINKHKSSRLLNTLFTHCLTWTVSRVHSWGNRYSLNVSAF